MQVRLSTTPVLAVAIYLLLDAREACAWGPATHAKLAADALGQAPLLPAALAGLLTRYASSYVFGNIAADVVFAKRWSRIKQFCHHWSTGFRLLESAGNDRDRAFAYGYLSHLAADTVAHGKFVPRQQITTRTTLNFGHLYWEMRADATVDRSIWNVLEEVMATDHEHHHRMLAEELTLTLLPYRLNRRVFDGLNRIVVRQYWRDCVTIWHRCSRWDLCAELVTRYQQESTERILSVLTDGKRSPVLDEDPNGTPALAQARLHRRERRRLRRRGVPTSRRTTEAIASLAPTPGSLRWRGRASCREA